MSDQEIIMILAGIVYILSTWMMIVAESDVIFYWNLFHFIVTTIVLILSGVMK